jgi:hypothetical protein
MRKEQDQDVEITVNDRRMFNPDGTLREQFQNQPPVAEPEPQAVAPEPEPAKPEPAQEQPRGKQKRGKGVSADFSNLVGMLTTNAILHLGIDPQYGKGSVDLETARHFIDMLAVLQEKTEGNLSEEESQLLEDMVSRLRMEYVAVANQLSVSAKNAKK